jgi:hypothetical protein
MSISLPLRLKEQRPPPTPPPHMHIDILCSNCHTVIDHTADLCECGLSLTGPTRNVYVEGPCNHCFCDELGEVVENQCTKSRCMGCRGKRKRGEFEDELSEVERGGAEADPREGKEILVKM